MIEVLSNVLKHVSSCYLAVSGVLLLFSTHLHAGPTGGQITAGVATINQAQPGETEINQSSDRAIIHWDAFNLNEDEFIQFNQPSVDSITVNRDLSGNMSEIMGEIDANGQIFILNPAGVFFGETAFVDVGGLVATDLDRIESGNIAEQFTLVDPNVSKGGVENHGVLRAGSGGIALIGQQVVNSGELQTRGGDLQLLAASEAIVYTAPGEMIGFELTEPVRTILPGSNFLIDNRLEGVVVSIDGGDIVYSARFVEDLMNGRDAINQAGVDNVVGVVNQAGDIYITDIATPETLVDTIINDVVIRDSTSGATDAGQTAAEIDQQTEQLASADESQLLKLFEEQESSKTVSALNRKGDKVKRTDTSRDETESEKDNSTSEKAKLAMKLDPNFFNKIRKTHLDQLIPDCADDADCQRKKAMKDFLGKMLVDGDL